MPFENLQLGKHAPEAQDAKETNGTNGSNGVSSLKTSSDPAATAPKESDGVLEKSQLDLSHWEEINADPERVKFAYWVPNVSGGLVISKIPQRTSWDMEANQRYAQKAEHWGFEYALSQIRFMAGYGAEYQHEPVSLSHAMLSVTKKLKVIAAFLPVSQASSKAAAQ